MALPALPAAAQPVPPVPAPTPSSPTPAVAPPVYVPVVLQPTTPKDSPNLISEITSLIDAVSHLGWVIIAVTALLIFRKELRNLLRKLKKGKLFGQEIEFEEELIELHEKTEEIKQSGHQVPTLPLSSETLAPSEDRATSSINSVLKRAEKSPRVALMFLSREIELALRETLAGFGNPKFREPLSLKDGISEITKFGIGQDLATSLELFQKVRNAILHGPGEPNEGDILSAIDSGTKLLSGLKSIPRTLHVIMA